jgi:PPP family 3-phenylpropionic acid transporter
LLYAALFFELGVSLPFLPLWLRSRGLDHLDTGIVLAVPLIIRVFANTAITAFADRTGRVHMTVRVCAVVVALATATLGVTHEVWPIVAVVALIALGQGPLIALCDALTLRHLRGRPSAEHAYGRIRLGGSIAFAAANLVAGSLVAALAPWSVVALLTAAAAAAAVAAFLIPDAPSGGPDDSRQAGPDRPTAPAGPAAALMLAGIVAGAALIQASHAAVYGFSTLHWQEQGHSGIVVGSLWACGILGEVAVFALAGRYMSGERGGLLFLMVGAGAALLRWVGMALDPPLAMVVLLQLTHGLSFGATHLGSVFLLARLASARQQAQAQGWLASMWAISMAGLTTASGWLSADWGQAIYWPMAATAALGLGLVMAVARIRGRAD